MYQHVPPNLLRVLAAVNCFSQILYLCGFPPVCVNMCCLTSLALVASLTFGKYLLPSNSIFRKSIKVIRIRFWFPTDELRMFIYASFHILLSKFDIMISNNTGKLSKFIIYIWQVLSWSAKSSVKLIYFVI